MKIRHITLGAMLLAIALTVFVVESQIPLPIPVPGFKIGLSNIITLITLYLWDKKHAALILVLRIVIGSVVCGSGIMVLYSLAGGVMCFFVMSVVMVTKIKESVPAVSMMGALAHNIAQTCVAAFVLDSFSVFIILPLLCSIGLVSGLFTGIVGSVCVKNKAVLKLFEGAVHND